MLYKPANLNAPTTEISCHPYSRIVKVMEFEVCVFEACKVVEFKTSYRQSQREVVEFDADGD